MSLQTLQKPASQPSWKRFVARREISLLAVLAFLFIVFSVLSDRFASVNTVGQILNNMAIVVIVGIGLALVLLTRNIDVSVGSMVGLTAYFAADFAVKNPQLPIIVVVLASCLLGLVLGSINGIIIATLRVPSIMVTLGTLYIYRGIDSILAGSNQVTAQSLPSGYGDLASWSLFGIPGLVIYAFVIAIAAHIFIRHTFTGRSFSPSEATPSRPKRWASLRSAASLSPSPSPGCSAAWPECCGEPATALSIHPSPPATKSSSLPQ